MDSSHFIDVDFALQPQYVIGDHSDAIFGTGAKSNLCASFGDVAPMINESEWREQSEATQAAGGGCARYVKYKLNQKREGSCVANAATGGHQIIQAKQFGLDRVVPLSAISLYDRIGSSPSSGANVGDGLEEMSERGIVPLDTPENRARFNVVMPATGFSKRMPEGWEESAKLFKAHEWVVCDSVDEVVSALLLQWPVMVGRSGHSICYCDVVYRDGQLTVKYINSWSPEWGEQGFGYDSLKMIKSAARWAYALRSVTAQVAA